MRRTWRRRALTTVVSTALVGAFAAPGRAAATSVTIDSLTRSGSVLIVAGRSSYANQPFVTLGTDPAGDALAPGVEYTGKDVIAFSMATAASGSLTVRWHLSQLPPALNRGVDVGYGKAFCVTPSEEPNCWVIIFVDIAGAPLTNSFVQGWRCPDETCAISAGDWIHTWETDQYDTAAKTASATIPLSDLGITPGSELTAVSSPNFVGSVFVTTPWWFLFVFTGQYPTYDGTAIDANYRVPAKEVSLAISAPGQAPEGVAYTTEASVDENGAYSGDLDVSGLAPGTHAVYARACFGANNCGYASAQVTL